MLHRSVRLAFAVLLLASTLAACGGPTPDNAEPSSSDDASAHDAARPMSGERDAEPAIPRGLLHLGGVSGLVVDVQGNRIAGARVEYGALMMETGEHGDFDLGDLDAGSAGTLVVTRDGFSTGRVPVSVVESATNHIRVTLQAAERARLADPSAGGEVETDSGIMMKLKPGAVVDEDGNPVTSPVDIVVALINDRDEMAAAPGGMMALDPEAREGSAPTQLESFGMVEVSLSADGRPVHLNGQSEVELRFPMAQNHPFNTDDTVGLWHFDENDDVWKNVGQGSVDAENKFKAQVTHFSWWNADQVLTKTCVIGRVLDSSGSGIAAANITGEGRSYLGSSRTSSDVDGNFCLEARVSSVIELSTLVRVGGAEQALAVNVNTSRTVASCGDPSDCYVLPEPLVAVADQPLCDPAACPADPAGLKQACCITDLGPCDFVVNGDCGGSADGSWDAPPEMPGVVPIPGVPIGDLPSTSDAGTGQPPDMDPGSMPMDAGTPDLPLDAGSAGSDAGSVQSDASASSDAGTGSGGSDSGAFDAAAGDGSSGGQSCGPMFASACMQCIMQNCASEVSACFGPSWQQGSFSGVCQTFAQCMCDAPSTDVSCRTPENVDATCEQCMAPAEACIDAQCDPLCSNSTSSDGGPGDGGTMDGGGASDGGMPDGGGHGSPGTPVDRCADAIALSTLDPVNGTTQGSTLLNDWYDDGACYRYLPGYERTFSVPLPPYAMLRARAVGPGMNVLIAQSCSDIDGSCRSSGSTASFLNNSPSPQTVYVTVDNTGVDAQAPFTLYLSTSAPACGDGFADSGEQCDDGNNQAADGCSGSCSIESGYVCPPDAACRQVVCGDGVRETGGGEFGAWEACDDGNTQSDDGCNSDCDLEPNWVCDQPGQPCRPIVCGDGLIDGQGGGMPAPPQSGDGGVAIPQLPEQCDDGNTNPADGCGATCQIEAGYACSGVPSSCEQRPDGDLCSNPLPLQTGSYDLADFGDDYGFAWGPDMLLHATVPGGQVLRITGTSAFDGQFVVMYMGACNGDFATYQPLGAGVPFDFAFDPMQFEQPQGPAMPTEALVLFAANNNAPDKTLVIDGVTMITPTCGDGIRSVSIGEQCDDGNTNPADGCDPSCRLEPGFVCPSGSACRPIVCGDGLVDWPDEDCEDGNSASGDGCGPDCHTEPGYLCDWNAGNCEMRPAGDLCNNAQQLPSGLFQGSFSLQGMSSDELYCSGCSRTRWFSVVQQPDEVTSVLISGDFEGGASFVLPACPQWGVSSGGPGGSFGPGYVGHSFMHNATGSTRTLWLRVSEYGMGMGAGNFELTVKTGPSGCGDGIREGSFGEGGPTGEGCDDMNNAGGDGCSADCQLEGGPFRCPPNGGPCEPIVCGDGVVDRSFTAPYEACDDGGNASGDGCSPSCELEPGALCSGMPSACMFTAPGDVCTNALPLPLGFSQHALDGFNPDLGCNDLCSGKDMWFSVVLQPREVLHVQLSANFTGELRTFGTGPGGCADRYWYGVTGNPNFEAGFGTTIDTVNSDNAPLTLMLAVAGNYDTGSGSFSLDVDVSIPNQDCQQGPCVPVVCGDSTINGTEQCDDGGSAGADGCSSNCVIEPGYGCFGTPSQCQLLLPGDTCALAEPLADGSYSLEGYTAESNCMAACNVATRWFSVDVPGRHTLALNLSTSDMSYGYARVIELASGSCLAPTSMLNSVYFGSGMPGAQSWVNPSFEPMHLVVAVYDAQSYPASSSFTLSHSLLPTGCGDRWVDFGGQYGAPEQCDQGGVTGNGCSASCQAEPGWDCSGGNCMPVVCGDGTPNGGEGCDDGATVDGDGCSATCTVESGYLCGGTPSSCLLYQPGDMCQNAQPLVDGSYPMSGYLPDLGCHDVCGGPDRWFWTTVPAGQTLAVRVASSDIPSGQIVSYDVTGGCDTAGPGGFGHMFGVSGPGGLFFTNTWAMPHTIAVAVVSGENPSSGSFDLVHAIKPTGCGDFNPDTYGYWGAPEQCDDGNNLDGDGCSSSCMIEPGYLCLGVPSNCVVPPPGDTCETAQELIDGIHGMSGYTPDSQCSDLCGTADRWFTTSVPSGELLIVDVSTTASYASAWLYERVTSTCGGMLLRDYEYFNGGPTSRLLWRNTAPVPVPVVLGLMDQNASFSSATFTLAHRTLVPTCGDGFRDMYGDFGQPEDCDDGGNTSADGCSATCNVEPGYYCVGEPSTCYPF